MSILFAGSFAELLGAPAYHSTAATGRDSAMTAAQVEFPQVGTHQIGFPLNVSSAAELWVHVRMHAAEATNIANSVLFEIGAGVAGAATFQVAKTTNGGNTEWFTRSISTATTTGGVTALAGATTHTLDVRCRFSGGNMIAELYVNGSLASSASRAATAANFAYFFITNALGRRTSGSNGIFLSELIVADESTLGMRVATLRPGSAGNYAEWAGTPADLDDFDPLSGLTTGASGQRVSRVHAAAPAGTIHSVLPTGRYIPNSGLPKLTPFVRISGTDHYAPASVAPGGNAPLRAVRHAFTQNPATSAAWVTADLAALDAGFRSESS